MDSAKWAPSKKNRPIRKSWDGSFLGGWDGTLVKRLLTTNQCLLLLLFFFLLLFFKN